MRGMLAKKVTVNDMKTLLIEDSKFQRIANGRTLIKAGYGVIYAGDGDEGLRIAREHTPISSCLI
jgi:response regulator RpfG family c-di-GMP phosphodiesterase